MWSSNRNLRCEDLFFNQNSSPVFLCYSMTTVNPAEIRLEDQFTTSSQPNKKGSVHPRVNNHQLWTVRMNWRGGRLSWHDHHSLLSPNFLSLTTYLLVYLEFYFYSDWMSLTFVFHILNSTCIWIKYCLRLYFVSWILLVFGLNAAYICISYLEFGLNIAYILRNTKIVDRLC